MQAIQRGTWLNNGSGWVSSTSWQGPEPFTKNGKNIGRRIGDVNGDGFGDIIIGYNDGSSDIKRTAVRNSTIPYLLKNITNEFGGVTEISYSESTIYNNTGEDDLSDIGFNVWVVEGVRQNNTLSNDFNIISNTSYYYFGGLYDYNDSEFRGFNIVNETLSDKSVISHYFHQNKQLKGKEYRTEIFDKNNNIFARTDNNFNFTLNNNSYFVVNLLSTSSYTYDGSPLNPKITNISYKYDNYSNLINKINFGDVNTSGDEKYENYTFAYNHTIWVLDKPTWYLLFDASHNKVRETKYFYDNKEYNSIAKGELSKVENWLDTGGGNPTTRYRYDNFGNLIEQLDPLGRLTKYEYGLTDSTFTYPERTINALGHKTDYTYDIFGNVLTETKNGITKTFVYDNFGRISKEILPYDDNDFPTKKYEYNFDGIAPEFEIIKQRTTSNNTIDTYFYYDGFANLVQIKSPADNGQVVKNLFYDELFRVKEEQNPFFYDSNINLTTITNLSNKTKYNYDALGRITSVVNPDGTTKNTSFNKWEINDYDENGNRHTYLLDAYDRIIAVTEYNTDFYLLDNEGYNTTYNYDGADNLIGIRDTYGNEFNFSYDSLGRKTRLDDPDLGKWQYQYDLTSNLIKQSNSEGVVVLGYDHLNRILQKNTTNYTLTFFYDKQFQGTLTNISHESTHPAGENYSLVYDYDNRLRIIKETVHENGDAEVTGMTYDSMDRAIEKALADGTDLDFYYNQQGKLNKIKGFINKTHYNALGNPLNRTYFNSKVTTFDYQSNNLRLRQIKTDTIQQLNYSYDNVGNVISINDSANNRSYSMSYDRLDRLTNVSINEFKWVYHYDAIGNILKIVRNFSQTTSFKYDVSLAHAPKKVITNSSGVDVYRQLDFNTSNKTKVVEFFIINEKNDSLVNVNWTAEFGDNNLVNSNIPFNLSVKENILVIVEHNYSKGGNYIVNLTGQSGNSMDYQKLDLIFGAVANALSILHKNASTIVTEFTAKNTINQVSINWSWNCSNGVVSTIPFNMSPNEELLIVMEHNYSLSNGNLSCSVFSADGNQSRFTTILFDGIKIEEYNSSLIDKDTIQIKFDVKNYFSTLNNINWNVTLNGALYSNASGTSLNQGQSTTITQEINFTFGGLKQIKVNIGSGNFTDSYMEYHYVKWLNLNQFFTTIKNATTRIFDFLITNENTINTTTQFNISNPALNYSLNLSNNESLIVVIEEEYPQGDKQVNIQIFNNSIQEENLIEIFKIRQISIEAFQTLFENQSKAVTFSIIKNNINPLNVSWRLNNTQELITSSQSVELNTSEQILVVIESNFSTSGIYPLTFIVNSSTYNDNATGVAVS